MSVLSNQILNQLAPVFAPPPLLELTFSPGSSPSVPLYDVSRVQGTPAVGLGVAGIKFALTDPGKRRSLHHHITSSHHHIIISHHHIIISHHIGAYRWQTHTQDRRASIRMYDAMPSRGVDAYPHILSLCLSSQIFLSGSTRSTHKTYINCALGLTGLVLCGSSLPEALHFARR